MASAACFGVLFASHLCDQEFFESFVIAMHTMHLGAEEVQTALLNCGADFLAERVSRNTGFDWNNIANWGSMGFFQ